MKLNQQDKQLIKFAEELVKANCDIYSNPDFHVACVIKAKSGKIYKGINIKTSHSVCAEQVALGQALACGERQMDTIVAVKLCDGGKKTRVVSPCGLCRYIFDKFDFDLKVIVEDISTGEVLKVMYSELLPYPYERDTIKK